MRLALCLGALASLLAAASSFGDFTIPGSSLRFVCLILLAGAAFLGAAKFFHRWSKQAPRSRLLLVFWSVAICLRLVVIGMEPGDDLWRYLWEGRIQLHGANPYVQNPQAPELALLRDAQWPKINHPESPAIYPPATELTFAAISKLSDSVLAFKLTFLIADLLTVLLLLRFCPPAHAVWYAWNPAVIYAFAGAGHYDSLMVLAMTAGFLLLHQKPITWLTALLSCTCLGLAIGLKLIPLLLLPAWTWALGRKAPLLLISLGLPVALSIPYGGLATVLGPLSRFAEVTRFNDLFWWLIEAVTIPNPYQRNWPFTLVLGLAVAGAAFYFRSDWRRCAFWSLGLGLLLSPVLHPWYATWILPLACWRRVHAWTILSLSALGALLLWESSSFWAAWQPNLLIRFIVLLPPIFAWHRQTSTLS